MKYIVDEQYYPMEFPEEERNTALSIAEILANKGREITIRLVADEEPNKEMAEIVCCADCALCENTINDSGRLVMRCQEMDAIVYGDFYCAYGPLNRREGPIEIPVQKV